MTYQGARARDTQDEGGQVFEVSKVRLDVDGFVIAVLWQEINSASNLSVGERVVASAAEVVDAIHDGASVVAVFLTPDDDMPERGFVVLEQDDGQECLALAEPSTPGRELADIETLDD